MDLQRMFSSMLIIEGNMFRGTGGGGHIFRGKYRLRACTAVGVVRLWGRAGEWARKLCMTT